MTAVDYERIALVNRNPAAGPMTVSYTVPTGQRWHLDKVLLTTRSAGANSDTHEVLASTCPAGTSYPDSLDQPDRWLAPPLKGVGSVGTVPPLYLYLDISGILYPGQCLTFTGLFLQIAGPSPILCSSWAVDLWKA